MLLTLAYVRGREGWRERREQGEVVKKGGKLYWVEIKGIRGEQGKKVNGRTYVHTYESQRCTVGVECIRYGHVCMYMYTCICEYVAAWIY